jgi:hypothetical protein
MLNTGIYTGTFIFKNLYAGYLMLMPVILAIQEAEIRRIAVQNQPS